MKEIPLTQGKIAIVDDSDYQSLSKHKWYAHHHRNTFYARRKEIGGKAIEMHHAIIGKPLPGKVTDHYDGNGLNNRRDNLRYVTIRENSQNRHHPKESRFPGVALHKQSGLWMAQIVINGTKRYLGIRKNEEDAAFLYRNAINALGGN